MTDAIKFFDQTTLIEIDLEGGLVQEVRTNQPGASVVVHDADAEEVGENPRTALEAVYDPTLGRENDESYALVERQKEAWGEEAEECAREQHETLTFSDDPDIPF